MRAPVYIRGDLLIWHFALPPVTRPKPSERRGGFGRLLRETDHHVIAWGDVVDVVAAEQLDEDVVRSRPKVTAEVE